MARVSNGHWPGAALGAGGCDGALQGRGGSEDRLLSQLCPALGFARLQPCSPGRGDQPLWQSRGAVHHLSSSKPCPWARVGCMSGAQGAAPVQTPHLRVGGSVPNLGREGQCLFPAPGGRCKQGHSTNNDMGMTQTAQQEGDAVGSAAPAARGRLYGFHPGPARPMDSVLLGAGRLGDADVNKERRGWDAGAILGEEMDVAVACRGTVRFWLMAAPHPTL